MLTPADVADLHAGDVITLSGQGADLTGALTETNGALYLTQYCCIRDQQGNPFPGDATITVVSTAPLPTYINCSRDPVTGDVARDADNTADTRTWCWSGSAWSALGTGDSPAANTPEQYRLLVDGSTGRFAAQ